MYLRPGQFTLYISVKIEFTLYLSVKKKITLYLDNGKAKRPGILTMIKVLYRDASFPLAVLEEPNATLVN